MSRKGKRVQVVCSLVLAALFALGYCCAAAEHDAWDCPECGRTGNTGNYCGTCSHPAPWLSIPEETAGEFDIPVLSDRYPGSDAFLRNGDRVQSFSGPGTMFASSGGFMPDKVIRITAFFREGDWILADIDYYTEERFVYFPAYSFVSVANVPAASNLDYYPGAAAADITPRWGPDQRFKADSSRTAKEGTAVKVFFRENGFVYAEYAYDNEVTRMWLPEDQIEISEEISSSQNKPITALSSVTVGETIRFGHYEQDRIEENESEPIEWTVLDVQDGKCLMLSRYGLDAKQYHDIFEDVTWESCSLRRWLNGDFLNMAFTEKERLAILPEVVDNRREQGYEGWKAAGGNNTKDHVFLLSYAEANQYLGVANGDESNTKARVAPTAYAMGHGAWASRYDKTESGEGAGFWWLRSPGGDPYMAATVYDNGSLSGCVIGGISGLVRPAVWLDLYRLDDVTDRGPAETGKKAAAETPADEAVPETKGIPEQINILDETRVRNFIANCYRTALGRKAGDQEIDNWMAEIKSGIMGSKVKEVACKIILSDEFRNRGLDHEDIIRILYLVFLQREPEDGGRAQWVGQLNQQPLETVVSGFAESEEFGRIIETMSQ